MLHATDFLKYAKGFRDFLLSIRCFVARLGKEA